MSYQLPYSLTPAPQRRQWAAEYGGALVHSAADVAAAKSRGEPNPNAAYTRADDERAADALWQRLRQLHSQGSLMGCSHRCANGVDHEVDMDGSEGRGDELDMDAIENMAPQDGDGDDEEGGQGDGDGEGERKHNDAPTADATRRCTVRVTCRTKEEVEADGGRVHVSAEAPLPGLGVRQKHAYALVDVQELRGYRLVRVRNPWGSEEWQGPWGDKVRRLPRARFVVRCVSTVECLACRATRCDLGCRSVSLSIRYQLVYLSLLLALPPSLHSHTHALTLSLSLTLSHSLCLSHSVSLTLSLSLSRLNQPVLQSEEVTTHRDELKKLFQARTNSSSRVEVEPFGANPNDGTFLMSFYDFRAVFTHIFSVVDFPSSWSNAEVTGSWTVSQCAYLRHVALRRVLSVT